MAPEIKPVGASSHIFCCIHADPGAGKTTFIGTGGKKYKILIIRPPTDHTDPIIGSGVQEMIVRDWGDVFDASDYLIHSGDKWDWVWVDSFSALSDMGIRDVYKDVVDSKGGRGKRRSMFGPDRGEYRVNMWRLEEWVSDVVGSGGGFNFGLMCHSFWYEPYGAGDDVQTAVWPWIQGKQMPQKISGMMNIVGFMEVKTREVRGQKKESRVIHFNKAPSWHAKCQFKKGEEPALSDLWNPTLPGMMEALEGARLHTREDRQRGRGRPSGPPAVTGTRPIIRRTTRKGA